MKSIIQRRLPLDVHYTVTDKKYIPVMEGYGCTCDNCGKLIANIATVKSIHGQYEIGFDCLETFLLNNNLLEGFSVEEFENVKKWIPKAIRLAKHIKEVIANNPRINFTGLHFEQPMSWGYVAFYYLRDGQTKGRDNDGVKLKDLDFNFLIATLKNIFPKLTILVY